MVVRADWPTDVEARLRSVTRHPTTPGHWAASSLKQSFPKGKHCGGQEFQGSVLDMRVMRELFWVAVLIPKLVDFLMRVKNSKKSPHETCIPILAEWKWWRFSPPWTRGMRIWSMMLRWISMALVLPPAPGDGHLHSAPNGLALMFFSYSDRSVRIFDVKDGTQSLAASLVGHEGPVWQVAWAHPRWTKQNFKMQAKALRRFGNILASCSYDRRVLIWQENQGQWTKVTNCFLSQDSAWPAVLLQ